ncbi:Uncharacterized protein EbC_pEb17201020 (plasmid) [Erwinia billingiae Eb661]|uniref:Uncharacterized protein n=1 Tax=Erwinia billingiae (strain Eb661) TaxID=634500 RepID=D8MJV7_ERWBE|nr:Uncharacterized protein EbC_pEb17201020 [Erwinia billingiae Eb661]
MEKLLFSMQVPVIGSQWFLLSHKLNITLFQKMPFRGESDEWPCGLLF